MIDKIMNGLGIIILISILLICIGLFILGIISVIKEYGLLFTIISLLISVVGLYHWFKNS